MNTVKAVFGLTLLGAAQASQAGFIAIDNVNPADTTVTIVNSNDFKSSLAGLGITNYTLSASLGVTGAGSVTYYYYGKEAGFSNEFTSGGLSFSTGFTPTDQNYFAAPIEIGTVGVASGLLDFRFCSNSSPLTSVGCVTNAQNDALAMLSFQSIAMNINGNTAWIFWDDSGAGPDDNHDDMLIKAVFTSQVPEPATLGLFSLGLLGVGFGARRKRSAKNV